MDPTALAELAESIGHGVIQPHLWSPPRRGWTTRSATSCLRRAALGLAAAGLDAVGIVQDYDAGNACRLPRTQRADLTPLEEAST
jgi:hypothetical protein